MRINKILVISILLLIQSCSSKEKNSPILFEIKAKNSIVYIFGSTHSADESIYPLPDYVMERFNKSKKLIFETDPRSFDTLLYYSTFYDENDDISNHISSETYHLLLLYCEEMDVSIRNLSKSKPFHLTYEIMVNELNRADIRMDNGIEAYFSHAVKNRNITIGGIESYEDNVFLISLIDSADFDNYLFNTLKEREKIVPNMIRMLNLWKNGEIQELAELFYEEIKDYPSMYRFLIEERNKLMISEIEKYIQKDEPVFILIGISHLIMNNNIIDVLRSKNYQVTMIKSDD